ncbi:efflux RND transporter permease subunit [Roseibium sp. HPY-6]|uniref:efflux RND transporter permease subunit n=1 Tax=Roseibium sp. HPY-6 TaxID=3229852 RepID=UPI00338DE725
METVFFRQPRLVALTILVIIAAGLSALVGIGRQEDPTITNLFATVTTVYPGADPARVEALVTEKIEEELREVEEIDVIESTSSSSISIVQIELLDTLTEEVIEQAWSEIRDKIGDATREFPQGVLEPEFSTEGAGAFASISALVPRHDGVSDAVLLRYAEALSDTLRNVPGTKSVEIFGEVEEEILVQVDPAVLTSLSLTVEQVSAAIRSADAKVRAGRLRGADREFLIEVEGEIAALDRIRQIPVTVSDTGIVTRVGDVAAVSKGKREPAEELAFSSGRPAILVAAKIADGLQVDTWMERVRSRIAGFEADMPYSIEHQLVFDQSLYTIDRLSNVGLNIAIGMGLVVAVLLVTMGLRSALIVAMVLPVVTLASFATMSMIGLPLHQMSLTGLIVALGLLVDAGIVMTDEIGQALDQGRTRRDAVAKAVRRLFAPLLASTVTTALSFMPMVLLPGPAGDFVGAIAIAVIIMLLWSFVVAVTLTAAIAGWILPANTSGEKTGKSGLAALVAVPFRFSLKMAMRNPASSVAFALVLPVIGFLSMPTLTAQFFPGVDRNQFHIEVELSDGTAISETAGTARKIDAALAGTQGIEQVSWVVGKSAPAFYYNIVGNRDRAPAFAQALVTTSSAAETARLVPVLQASLSSDFPEARILVRDLVQGPPVDAPVELRLVGPSLEVLRVEGDKLRELAARVEEVTIVRTTLDGGSPKLKLSVNEDKARLLGLGLGEVAQQLEATLEGATGGSLIEGTEELPVRVRVGASDRGDLSRIASLPLLPGNGVPGSAAYNGVPLSAIADIRMEPAEGQINRRNGERTNTVQAFVQYGVLPEEALKKLQSEVEAAGFALPDGYRIETGGDSDARDDTLTNLIGSLGLIVPLSIAAIVLTFNSFRLSAVTLVVAVLSAGLSIFALAVFQYPFGINAIIGVIGSIGVSINAAIIILTGMQQNEGAVNGDQNAMVDVVMGSSRHIVSTTLTTFGGFLPLILEGGGFWPPFAMSIAGGVLLSTVISFYFAPPMFALVYARKRKPAASEETKPQAHDERSETDTSWSNDNYQPAMAAE